MPNAYSGQPSHPYLQYFDVLVEDDSQMFKSERNHKDIVVPPDIYHGDLPRGSFDIEIIENDKEKIRQVLINLIANAIKFTDEGSIDITARLLENKGSIRIDIADTGIGIARENISRIFQLDNRYTRKGTEKERGSGLGLILCREFVEKHNGTIRVESEPGKGSNFIFTLPV